MLQISVTGNIAKVTYFPANQHLPHAASFILIEDWFNGQQKQRRQWAVLVPHHMRTILKYHEAKNHLVMVVSCDLWPTGEAMLFQGEAVPYTLQAIALQRVSV